jgi:hypothetical protein
VENSKLNYVMLRASRQAGKSRAMELMIKSLLTVDHWLEQDMTEEDMELFSDAKKAAELKKTKLYKALK